MQILRRWWGAESIRQSTLAISRQPIRIEFALRFYIRVCPLSKRLWVPDALRLGMPQSRWGTDGLRGQRWPELSKQGYL